MRRVDALLRVSLYAAFVALAPDRALADAGLPMIFVSFPIMLIALAPVIAVEAWTFWRGGLPTAAAIKMSAWANAVSTIAGIPVTWALVLLAEMITGASWDYFSRLVDPPHGMSSMWTEYVFPGWIAPVDGTEGWAIPFAQFVLLFWFFWASVLIERFVAKRVCPEVQPARIDALCLRANLWSYACLAALSLSVILTHLPHG